MSKSEEDQQQPPVVDPLTGEPLPDTIRLAPVEGRPLLLVIDNYDSFTYNLVQYLEELGAETRTYRNDQITLHEARALWPDGIVISPGPGNPKNERDFGVSGGVLKELSPTTPTLGVCLGLQGFAAIYHGDVTYAKEIMHGKTSTVTHNGSPLFQDVPTTIRVGRYHSLVADPKKIPDELLVTATTEDNEIMGIDHRDHPIMSVQFHPESILTQHGKTILRNFLQIVADHKKTAGTPEGKETEVSR